MSHYSVVHHQILLALGAFIILAAITASLFVPWVCFVTYALI